MSTFTIEQLKGMVGMVITRTEVRVKHLYPREEKSGAKGSWFQQKGYIQDKTGEMVIVFNDLPDQMSLVGKTLIFKSMQGKQGLKGVQVKSWEGKKGTNIELVVTPTSLIVRSEEEEKSVAPVTPSTRMPQNEPEPAAGPSGPGWGGLDDPSKRNATEAHSDRKLGLAMASNRMTQLAGLYDLCWKTVAGMGMFEALSENDYEIHKDIATTLFIQGVRENLQDKFPIRTLEKFFKEGVQESPVHESQKGYDLDRENDEIPF